MGAEKVTFRSLTGWLYQFLKGENYSLPHKDHQISIMQIHPPIHTIYFVHHELSIIAYLLQRQQVKQAKLSQLNCIQLNVKE